MEWDMGGCLLLFVLVPCIECFAVVWPWSGQVPGSMVWSKG